MPLHHPSMRHRIQFLSFLLLWPFAASVWAPAPGFQLPSIDQQLIDAEKLNEQGQFHALVALLAPMVQADAHLLEGMKLGIAWNLLGAAYMGDGDYDKAQHCFEAASQIFGAIPAARQQYATALDDLGTLESATGQFEQANALHKKARRIYQDAGDHAGTSITSVELAGIAIKQNHLRLAHRELDKGFDEAKLVDNHGHVLDNDDIESMYSVQGSLEMADRNYRAAIAAFQQAIDFWTAHRNPRYYLLGALYALRGEAVDKLGNHQEAVANIRQALSIFSESLGQNHPAYLMTQLQYARLLRESGAKQEAGRQESAANAALLNFRRQQCTGCTVSAATFR